VSPNPADEHERLPKPVILSPDGGRRYDMGALTAVFKADEDDTQSRDMPAIVDWFAENR
jgi:hypothetical protein